ncbi:hypothetical protein AAMO2058_001151600 [Amorphochlora amoebiformis]
MRRVWMVILGVMLSLQGLLEDYTKKGTLKGSGVLNSRIVQRIESARLQTVALNDHMIRWRALHTSLHRMLAENRFSNLESGETAYSLIRNMHIHYKNAIKVYKRLEKCENKIQHWIHARMEKAGFEFGRGSDVDSENERDILRKLYGEKLREEKKLQRRKKRFRKYMVKGVPLDISDANGIYIKSDVKLNRESVYVKKGANITKSFALWNAKIIDPADPTGEIRNCWVLGHHNASGVQDMLAVMNGELGLDNDWFLISEWGYHLSSEMMVHELIKGKVSNDSTTIYQYQMQIPESKKERYSGRWIHLSSCIPNFEKSAITSYNITISDSIQARRAGWAGRKYYFFPLRYIRETPQGEFGIASPNQTTSEDEGKRGRDEGKEMLGEKKKRRPQWMDKYYGPNETSSDPEELRRYLRARVPSPDSSEAREIRRFFRDGLAEFSDGNIEYFRQNMGFNSCEPHPADNYTVEELWANLSSPELPVSSGSTVVPTYPFQHYSKALRWVTDHIDSDLIQSEDERLAYNTTIGLTNAYEFQKRKNGKRCFFPRTRDDQFESPNASFSQFSSEGYFDIDSDVKLDSIKTMQKFGSALDKIEEKMKPMETSSSTPEIDIGYREGSEDDTMFGEKACVKKKTSKFFGDSDDRKSPSFSSKKNAHLLSGKKDPMYRGNLWDAEVPVISETEAYSSALKTEKTLRKEEKRRIEALGHQIPVNNTKGLSVNGSHSGFREDPNQELERSLNLESVKIDGKEYTHIKENKDSLENLYEDPLEREKKYIDTPSPEIGEEETEDIDGDDQKGGSRSSQTPDYILGGEKINVPKTNYPKQDMPQIPQMSGETFSVDEEGLGGDPDFPETRIEGMGNEYEMKLKKREGEQGEQILDFDKQIERSNIQVIDLTQQVGEEGDRDQIKEYEERKREEEEQLTNMDPNNPAWKEQFMEDRPELGDIISKIFNKKSTVGQEYGIKEGSFEDVKDKLIPLLRAAANATKQEYMLNQTAFAEYEGEKVSSASEA